MYSVGLTQSKPVLFKGQLHITTNYNFICFEKALKNFTGKIPQCLGKKKKELITKLIDKTSHRCCLDLLVYWEESELDTNPVRTIIISDLREGLRGERERGPRLYVYEDRNLFEKEQNSAGSRPRGHS